MELIDLLDENRKSTGETIERGKTIPEGRYKQSVHIWITNSKGEIYIQKRAECRKIFPGFWENPGGGVVRGQTPTETLKKEFLEELGINITGKVSFVTTIRRKKDFVDIWHITQDFDISDLHLQEDEVSEGRWVTLEEIENMIDKNQFCPTILDSFNPFLQYLNK